MNLKTIVLAGERAADKFVSAVHDGFHTTWNGWTIETFIPNASAEYSPRGSYNRDLNSWGYTYTFRPSRYGKWYVKVPA